MKKRFILFTLMVALVVCLFAISASAAIVKHETDPGLDCADSAVSTLDYSAFNNSTASDKTSRVVLTDGTYYYVFPAYYVFTTNTNFAPTLTNINAAMKAADSTITTDLFTSSKTAFVRIQLPTWISNIDQGTGKLEGWTAIKEFRFGTTLKSITAQNAFSNCTNLEYISDISHMTSINNAGFSGCTNLKIHINWPAAVKTINTQMFAGSGITSITIPEGVTSIGGYAFQNCDNLTELILPNTVTSAGKHAFGSCDKLETLNLGAGFKTASSSNHDFETTSSDKKLKYVYFSENFLTTINSATAGSYKHIFNISETKIVFFFTGTEEQANLIKEKMTTVGNNVNLSSAVLEQYNPNTDYTDYASTKGSNIIVWGYNECKAFYNDVHTLEEGTSLSVDSYVQAFDELCVCTRCEDATKVNEEAYAPIFELLGVSASMSEGSVCVGYSFDKASYDAYTRVTGKTISFGVVGIIPPENVDMDTFEPVNTDLTPYDSYTILANITDQYASFDFIINGFTSEYYDTTLTMCAFVGDGTKVDYITSENGETVQLEYATTFTFNDKLQA